MKQFVEIHSLRSKVRHSLNPLLPFSPAENGFSGSFEKLSTVQLTCSEGALFFQYMVMRNVQLTELHKEEVHNKGGGGDEGRQYNAANYAELFMLHKHEQV